MEADNTLDFLEGKIVPFNIKCCKGGMLAGGKHMVLIVTSAVPKLVTDVTAVSTIVPSCSGVGAVDLLGSGSCPEGPKFDLQDVLESIIRAGRGVPEVSARVWEGATRELLEAAIGFCMCGVI